jgi:hypothetical protein
MRAAFLSFFLLVSSLSYSQTADEVITNYLNSIGGVKKWKEVKGLITRGEYDYGGISFPFTTYAKSPNLYKFIVPLEGKFYAQGFDGKKGWKIDGFKNEKKPTLLEGTFARAMANEADVELENPFVKYKAKGHTIKLDGTDTVENKACYKVLLDKKNGQTETYYFTTDTYTLLLKVAVAKNVELEGALLNTYFYAYKQSGGLTMSFKQVCKIGDQTILTITVKEVMLDDEIAKETFQPN